MDSAGQPAKRFAVVGGGRAGLSISAALVTAGWKLVEVYGRDAPKNLATDIDAIILAVPDHAIQDAASRLTPGRAVVLHLSGATGLGALQHHKHVGSVHPLMSLPNPEVGATRLMSGGFFAVSGHPLACELVESLGGTIIKIDDAQRPLYHATATIAANHLVALCAQVERLCELLQVPCTPYWDLMRTTLDNVIESGAQASLTGPASRGDLETLALHLGALEPKEHAMYRVLADKAGSLAGHTIDWDEIIKP